MANNDNKLQKIKLYLTFIKQTQEKSKSDQSSNQAVSIDVLSKKFNVKKGSRLFKNRKLIATEIKKTIRAKITERG